MEIFGKIPVAQESSKLFDLLAVLADPVRVKAELTELNTLVARNEAALAGNLKSAKDAEKAVKIAGEAVSQAKALREQGEAEAQRGTALAEAAEGERAQIAMREQAVIKAEAVFSAKTADTKKQLASREASIASRESAIANREESADRVKAEYSQRLAALKVAAGV